jgi:pyridoxamine 5'-phosphate oxidase
MNPRVFESEMPTFTSDVRMMKIPELFSSGSGHATKEEQMQGSGGGGPCEAVYWIKETQVQWRLKGEAFVVGPDIEGEGEQSKESSGVRTVKSELGSRMRIVDEGKQGEWSWNKELTAHFGNNSPGLRGAFCDQSLDTDAPMLTSSTIKVLSKHPHPAVPLRSLTMRRI